MISKNQDSMVYKALSPLIKKAKSMPFDLQPPSFEPGQSPPPSGLPSGVTVDQPFLKDLRDDIINVLQAALHQIRWDAGHRTDQDLVDRVSAPQKYAELERLLRDMLEKVKNAG